ncbi:hypothetical protein BY458DRAFT_475546 [Sporodiniella umbellata]|nr:hypothetical protein BY458DRAFT_475546 [Sporodiniella umbellata]
MSDGLFSKHAVLNAGAIPVSAEELSQRYAKLFQQYSRLKAQHTVLKKAVIKEQASNVALQGNVKEKEKEIRKLQEQLDLLSFHNERLTKRIQAVQGSEQKGSYFSILGGSVKKELEENTKALDAANSELERRILENEQLNNELTEKQFEFTTNINTLLKQIQDLESQINGLKAENASLQSDVQGLNTTEHKEALGSSSSEALLAEKVDELKLELDQKTNLLDEQNEKMKANDVRLLSEIRSLRAIVFAKMGSLETLDLKDVLHESWDSLKNLEEASEKYVQSVHDNDNKELTPLPHEMAERLALSHEIWRKELEKVTTELEDKKKEMSDLLEKAQQGFTKENEHQELLKQIYEKHKEEQEKLEQQHNETLRELDIKYDKQSESHVLEKENAMQTIQDLEAIRDSLQNENTKLQQEIEHIHIHRQSAIDNEAQTDPEAKDEGDDEVFIYPTKAEEEDEEAFVYTGIDAIPTSKENKPEKQDEIDELKISYEKQVCELNEKLQLSDSKALRLENMFKNLESQLSSKEETNQMLQSEIEELKKKVKHSQDMLTTTETNYQSQVDAMTEMITMLQQEQR